MTRRKVKLQYITDDSQRKATFKKRKKGLVKKATELSTLCGIDACAIIYSPYEAQPEVWPSPAGAHRLLSRYKKLPEVDQTKKMLNQEGFLKKRLDKESEKLKKQWTENREKEMTQVMNQGIAGNLPPLQNMTMFDVKDLMRVIDQNLKSVRTSVYGLMKLGLGPQDNFQGAASSSMVAPHPPNAAAPPPPDAAGVEMQFPDWFRDLMDSPDNVAGSGVGAGAAGDDIILPPFGNGNPSSSNQYFP